MNEQDNQLAANVFNKPYECKDHLKLLLRPQDEVYVNQYTIYSRIEWIVIGSLESGPDGRRLILYNGERRWLKM